MINWGDLIIDSEPPSTLLDALKLFLGIDPSDTDKDDQLNRALNNAGAFTETYLDRIIAKRPVDEYFEHHFGTVELHHMPVDTAAPVNVFLNGHQQTDYEVYLRRGKTAHLTRIGHDWDAPLDWRHFDQVTVTYTAGYDPLPSDLAQALVYTSAGLYTSEGSGSIPGGASGDVKSMTVFDVGSISYDVGGSSGGGSGEWPVNDRGVIPSTAAQILSAYRRLSA